MFVVGGGERWRHRRLLLPVVVELVAKAGMAGLDADGLRRTEGRAQARQHLQRPLAWYCCPRRRGTVECRAVRAVERWADAHPGVHFTRPADVEPSARARAPDHDAKPAPCKFWLNQGTCHKGDACRYAHDPTARDTRIGSPNAKRQPPPAVPRRGRPARCRRRREQAPRREIAEWLVATFGEETLRRGSGVLDVMGGLRDALARTAQSQGRLCTLVEPRPRKLNRLQHKWLKKRRQRERKAEEWNQRVSGRGRGRGRRIEDDAPRSAPRGTDGDGRGVLESAGVLCAQIRAEFTPDNWHAFADCSVVVGMHPDQATEAIVDFAAKFGKPFAVVPCWALSATVSPSNRPRGRGRGRGRRRGRHTRGRSRGRQGDARDGAAAAGAILGAKDEGLTRRVSRL